MSFDLQSHALGHLPHEDLDLILELVLQSGSLKDLAAAYQVSYPTIRVRLDKVIARLRALQSGQPTDPMTDLLARMIEQGQITAAAARSIRELHQRTQATGDADRGLPGATIVSANPM